MYDTMISKLLISRKGNKEGEPKVWPRVLPWGNFQDAAKEERCEEVQTEETDFGEAKMPGTPGHSSGESCLRREYSNVQSIRSSRDEWWACACGEDQAWGKNHP